MKNPLFYRSAQPESDREVRKRFLMAPLALSSSERQRLLALVSGFRLLRWFGSNQRTGTPARECANESLALTIKYVYPLPESHEISEEYVT